MNPLIIAMIVAQSFDAGITVAALNKGCREAMIPTQSPMKIVLTKSAATVAFTWTFGKVQKKSKPAGRVIAGTVIGMAGAAAVWNATQLSKCGGR